MDQVMDISRSNSFLALLTAVVAVYVAYQLLLHPLASFNGPRLAALTNLWKAYKTYRLRFHDELLELHARYGPVVRVGPNALHIQDSEAVATIYKGGRAFPKTHFYSAFQTFNHNLFGTQDDDLHALRRRQLAHGFSQKSIVQMENILDAQLIILCDRLSEAAKTGAVVDLEDMLSRYVLDVLGEVAFSRSFEAQTPGAGEFATIPSAINGHILLACVIGELPWQSLSKQLLAWSPIRWMRDLVISRQLLKDTCASCVRSRIARANDRRKDLLQSLIKARDPETGVGLSEIDINTEAFAMLVAGSHTTAGTLTLFFAHVLRQRNIVTKLQSELSTLLGPPQNARQTHAIDGLEDRLPYLMACVRENFRMSPVFTMMLWRLVTSREGLQIDDKVVPEKTHVAASNYVQHHSPAVWGADHDIFDPERWNDERKAGRDATFIPFSLGHRMCIGRNLAMTNILKTLTTILTRFELRLDESQHEQPVELESCGIGELRGKLLCVVTALPVR